MEIRNKSLYRNFKDLIEGIPSIVESFEKKYTRIKPYIEKSNIFVKSFTSSNRYHIDLFITLHQNSIKFFSDPRTQKVVESIKSDKTVSKHINTLVGGVSSRIRFDSERIIFGFISSYYRQNQDSLNFNIDIFDKTYYDFEQFFFKDSIDRNIIVPFQNIIIRKDIKLSESLSLKVFNNNEINDLWFLNDNFVSLDVISSLSNYLKYEYNEMKIIGDSPKVGVKINQEWNDLFTKILFAINLFKGKKAEILMIMDKEANVIGYSGISSQMGSTIRNFNPFEMIEFSENEVDEFLELWNKVIKIDLNNQLYRNIFDDYDSLILEKNNKMIIVKCFILLELMFNEKFTKERITSNFEKYKDLEIYDYKNILYDYYEIRNKIVHGGVELQNEIFESASKMKSIVRQILLDYIYNIN